jgi:hypothetical protein
MEHVMSHSLQEIQARLAQLGLYGGRADGINGPKTIAAVKQFQASVGLVADGLPGPVTQSHLFPEAIDPALGRDVDPPSAEPAHIAPIWPRQAECDSFYGAVGEHQVSINLPWTMYLAWDDRPAVQRITCHERVADSVLRCLSRIGDAYDEAARADLGIDQFGGCLNVRPMRGGSRPSMHAWGIAIDFDPDRNQLKWGADRARLAQPDAETFWRIWEDEGWVSLGRARNFDWMHVQAARL